MMQSSTGDGGTSDARGAQDDAASAESVSADVTDILETVDVPIVVVGRNCKIARFNPAARATLGLTPSDIGRLPRNIRALKDMKDFEKLCAQVIADGAPCRRDIRNGDQWFILRIAPYTGSDRQVGGAVLTFANVTALRASIAQAIYEREYTKAILNTITDALVVLDSDLRVQTGNRAFYAMFQISREETQGIPLYDLGNHDWDTPQLWALLKKTISGNSEFKTLEVEHDFPAIGRRTVLLDACRLSRGSNPGHMILLAFQDITERKEAEKAKARLAAIVESSDDAIISKDLNGIISSWNHGAERLFGYTAEEAMGQSVNMLIPLERLDEEPAILERIRRGERIEQYETVRRRKDGTLLDISLTVSPIVDAHGQIVGASKIARNITERKQAEEELRRRKEELTAFFESATIGLHWVGPDGIIQWANPAELAMLGYAKEEYEGHHIAEFHADQEFVEDILTRLGSGEKLKDHEARLRCKDGSIKHVLVDSSVLWDEGSFIHTQCFTRDITERKQAEETLRATNEELARFNRAMVDRELRMIELKKEVNELCQRQGQAPPYPLEFEQEKKPPLKNPGGRRRRSRSESRPSRFEHAKDDTE